MSIAPVAGCLPHLNCSQGVSRPQNGATPGAQASGTLGKVSSVLGKIRDFAAGVGHNRPGALIRRLGTFLRNNPRATAALCLGVGLVVGALLCIPLGPAGVFIGAAAGVAGFLGLNCLAGLARKPLGLDESVLEVPAEPPSFPFWSEDPATSAGEYLEIVMPSPQAH